MLADGFAFVFYDAEPVLSATATFLVHLLEWEMGDVAFAG